MDNKSAKPMARFQELVKDIVASKPFGIDAEKVIKDIKEGIENSGFGPVVIVRDFFNESESEKKGLRLYRGMYKSTARYTEANGDRTMNVVVSSDTVPEEEKDEFIAAVCEHWKRICITYYNFLNVHMVLTILLKNSSRRYEWAPGSPEFSLTDSAESTNPVEEQDDQVETSQEPAVRVAEGKHILLQKMAEDKLAKALAAAANMKKFAKDLATYVYAKETFDSNIIKYVESDDHVDYYIDLQQYIYTVIYKSGIAGADMNLPRTYLTNKLGVTSTNIPVLETAVLEAFDVDEVELITCEKMGPGVKGIQECLKLRLTVNLNKD